MEKLKYIAGRAGLVSGVTAGLGMVALVLAGPASAAVGDDPALDGINDMAAKVTTYGGAIVALVVLSAALFLGIKYLRKGVSKA